MHGNVWEWCLDRWDGSLPGSRLTNNPAAATGTWRVARGGSWLYEAKACRCANRDATAPPTGAATSVSVWYWRRANLDPRRGLSIQTDQITGAMPRRCSASAHGIGHFVSA